VCRRVVYSGVHRESPVGFGWTPFNRAEDPTMTEEMIALLEKSSDADLLREMIRFTAQRLMELEVAGLTGAGQGERSPERINWRNVYRERD
jgi:transposase-like protein